MALDTRNPNILRVCEGGAVARYSSHGSYPLYYVAKDYGILCGKCVDEEIDLCVDPDNEQWFIIRHAGNFEDSSLCCDHCGEQIEAAYVD